MYDIVIFDKNLEAKQFFVSIITSSKIFVLIYTKTERWPSLQ